MDLYTNMSMIQARSLLAAVGFTSTRDGGGDTVGFFAAGAPGGVFPLRRLPVVVAIVPPVSPEAPADMQL